mmetsp:Transcript_57457/g.134550  ORF Transcript_57457/g.134550 Transcript_57457/m.134550 type:complete len:92 (+) Transcript_57457:50-325(+)
MGRADYACLWQTGCTFRFAASGYRAISAGQRPKIELLLSGAAAQNSAGRVEVSQAAPEPHPSGLTNEASPEAPGHASLPEPRSLDRLPPEP